MDSSRPGAFSMLTTALVLVISACGTNEGSDAQLRPQTRSAGASDEPAGSAPASAATDLSGELTVWAMGAEGTSSAHLPTPS